MSGFKKGMAMGTNETKAMASARRERDAFESAWTRYVNALERREEALTNHRALAGTRRPGHWHRIARGAFREAERAHAVLTTRFDMSLDGVL